ncbi:MAG: SDR family NAD(P)-dependent oxidoreductase, partial [Chloroflexia bacterium]
MGNAEKPVVLITGASSGIGLACARYLADRGYRVFGTSRHPEACPPEPFPMIQMDVCDDASVLRGVEAVRERAGRIDVLVNNAGIGYGGAIEDTSLEEAHRQFETNFFGALRLCRAVLPIMRAQGSGLIVNMSSIGGLIGLPFQGLYSATKFALEGMSEALRL